MNGRYTGRLIKNNEKITEKNLQKYNTFGTISVGVHKNDIEEIKKVKIKTVRSLSMGLHRNGIKKINMKN